VFHKHAINLQLLKGSIDPSLFVFQSPPAGGEHLIAAIDGMERLIKSVVLHWNHCIEALVPISHLKDPVNYLGLQKWKVASSGKNIHATCLTKACT